MKPVKKIIALSVLVFSIVLFWVVPGINMAKETKYTRYYEDTEKRVPSSIAIVANSREERDTTSRRRKKVYRKESIEPRKSREVSAKMFSRAIQFEPEIVTIDSVMTDSVQVTANKIEKVKVLP
jgi:hypothetical protein